MTRPKTTRRLPASQRNNIKALLKTRDEIAKLTRGLHRAYDQRHRLITRIFDEMEKNPSLYSHLTRKGAKRSEPMTTELAKKLRAQYQQAFRPLAISGPGCDSPPACDPIPNCVCVFSVGTLCCYLCLSTDVVQCYF